MNPDTGVFTTPVSGIYYFSFSACIDATVSHITYIFVKKNGKNQIRISSRDNEDNANFANIGYSWAMSLVQNDQIQLTITDGGLQVYNDAYIWFNGNLLMKE